MTNKILKTKTPRPPAEVKPKSQPEITEVYVVTLELILPFAEPVRAPFLAVFDRQPSADDIHNAFCTNEFMRNHEHFKELVQLLDFGLAHWGVPKLPTSHLGGTITVQTITTSWVGNLTDPKQSLYCQKIGGISIRKKIIYNVV